MLRGVVLLCAGWRGVVRAWVRWRVATVGVLPYILCARACACVREGGVGGAWWAW